MYANVVAHNGVGNIGNLLGPLGYWDTVISVEVFLVSRILASYAHTENVMAATRRTPLFLL